MWENILDTCIPCECGNFPGHSPKRRESPRTCKGRLTGTRLVTLVTMISRDAQQHLLLVEKFVALQESRQAAILRQLVTATQKLTKPLCVEYIAAAEDGMGRLYARQVSAQSLTREARYLLYGQSHKEVDMSGAHYELLGRSVGTLRLPLIAQIREAIIVESQGIVQDPQALAKHLPLRLLNTNASCTLAFAREQGYIPGGRLFALFWEIENLRDHHLPAMLSFFFTAKPN